MKLKKIKTTCILSLILFFIRPVFIYGDFELDLQLKVLGLEQAGPPQIHSGYLVLTYETASPVRYIGVRFEHENYASLHVYTRNENGVFFCIHKIPQNTGEIRYRIVIDGIWLSDPFNPDSEYDVNNNVMISRISIDQVLEEEQQNPVLLDRRHYKFILNADPGQIIAIMGDFNNWDPYMYVLKENSRKPGEYSIILEISPGRNYYVFMINGRAILDPENDRRAYNKRGEASNYFDALY